MHPKKLSGPLSMTFRIKNSNFRTRENIKNKTKIIRFIKDKRPFVIALNSLNYLQEKLVNVRAICHPKRIISDFDFLNRINTPIIAPISSMPEKLKNYLKLDNKIIFDFGLHLNGKKNFCW